MKKPSVALVTGAAKRIGAKIAKVLHATGMNVVLHCNHSQQAAKKLCAELNNIRENSAIWVCADLANDALLYTNIINKTIGAFGRLDVLVNNASSFYPTKIGSVDTTKWDDLIGTNLKAPFFLAQAAMPFLQKSKGSIINICDIYAKRPLKNYPIYSLAKAGLVALTKILSKELAPNIRVNAISPGKIIWPNGVNALTATEKKSMIETIPLKRQGSPEDIAEAVIFFVLNANYVTGQVLAVDGGRSL